MNKYELIGFAIFNLIIILLFKTCGAFDTTPKTTNQTESSVNLMAFGDKFICDDQNMSDTLIANRQEANDWERFTLVYFDPNSVAIKSFKNKYVTVDLGKTNYLIANAESIENAERFVLMKQDGDYFAFKTSTGVYLCSDQTIEGKLIANRQAIGDWEKFKIKEIRK